MKTILFILALASVAVARGSDYSFKEPFTRSAAFDANGDITFSNVNGSVVIRTWDKNEILVEGEKSAKTEEELKLIDLTIDLTPSHATIKSTLPKRSGLFGDTIHAAVSFTITVPVNASLAKTATVNGSIKITGVRGHVDAESVNGSIHATGLTSEARLATVNGSVHAGFVTIAASKEITAKSVNGRIDIELPKDAGAEVHASSVNGTIHCAFPLTLAESTRGNRLSGKIGDGRASLNLHSVNGSIHVDSL